MNITKYSLGARLRVSSWQWFGVLLWAALATGPGSAAAETGPGKFAGMTKGHAVNETILTRADSGNTVDLRVGERLLVRLEESPTTGFAWTREGGNDALVQQDSDFAPASAGVGGGGLRSFLFMAEKAGVVQLRLRLWRAWEGDSSVIEVFTATARILPK